MTAPWTNWSGVLRFAPARIEHPESEEGVVALVRAAAQEGRVLRPVGAGHSSMPLVETTDVLVSLDGVSGVFQQPANGGRSGEPEDAHGLVTVAAGTQIGELTEALLEHGLQMENVGDVDVQTIGGAVATGTHGSGVAWGSIASTLVGARFVDGRGQVVECAERGETLRAVQVSLGALGICTQLTLRCIPAQRVYERRSCMSVGACLDQLDELMSEHEYCDFYWYPRRDEVGMRARGFVPADMVEAWAPEAGRVGWMREILPHTRTLRFNEMEYALPSEVGPACFQAVRRRMLERHRHAVAWRVLYRTVAAEDAYLSPSYGRDSVTISIHQNAHLPFAEFFADIEPIFRSFGGRPHWAKRHTLGRAELSALYPMWDRFCEVRHRFDPDGRFLNEYLHGLFSE